MLLTITYEDDKIYTLEVDNTATVATLSSILEFESNVPQAEQQLWHRNQQLQPSASLQSSGVGDQDLLTMTRRATGAQPQGGLPGGMSPQQLLDQVRGNEQVLNSVPLEMRSRILRNDVSVMEELVRFFQARMGRMQQADVDALNQDEFDPEAQKKIAEAIQQENVEANMNAAMEHSPEAFGSVTMLYVKLEVNNTPLKAFVDSGAQVCVMSRRCAERCNIAHLVDKRFAGIMKGVGMQTSHGRIHTVPVKVGNEHLPMAVTVLETSDVDLLFGLDMLRRYRCSIDLENNCLRFGNLENTSLEFLPDHELPDFGGGPGKANEGTTASGTAGSAGAAAAAGAAASARAAANSGQLPASSPAVSALPMPQGSAPGQVSSGGPAPASLVTRGGSGAGLDAKVQQLMGLGFSKNECEQALSACNGDVDQAGALLFGG